MTKNGLMTLRGNLEVVNQKDRQHNDQEKYNKRTNNDKQNITQ